MITYKANILGLKVEFVLGECTSQTCPVCGSRNHPIGCNYEWKNCEFRYYRNGVEPINV
ncbi:MAG: transposase [Fervidobacterium sp.]|nr:transposase [Fervidobacterium sp.]